MTPPRDDTVCALVAALLTAAGEADRHAARCALADRLEELGGSALAADVRAAVPHLLVDPILVEAVRRHAGRARDALSVATGRPHAGTAFVRELRAAVRILYDHRRGLPAGETILDGIEPGPEGLPVAYGTTGRGREFQPWTPSLREDGGGDIVDRGRPPSPAWPDVWLDRGRTLRHCRVLLGRGLLGIDVPADAGRLVALVRPVLLAILFGRDAARHAAQSVPAGGEVPGGAATGTGRGGRLHGRNLP